MNTTKILKNTKKRNQDLSHTIVNKDINHCHGNTRVMRRFYKNNNFRKVTAKRVLALLVQSKTRS